MIFEVFMNVLVIVGFIWFTHDMNIFLNASVDYLIKKKKVLVTFINFAFLWCINAKVYGLFK